MLVSTVSVLDSREYSSLFSSVEGVVDTVMMCIKRPSSRSDKSVITGRRRKDGHAQLIPKSRRSPMAGTQATRARPAG